MDTENLVTDKHLTASTVFLFFSSSTNSIRLVQYTGDARALMCHAALSRTPLAHSPRPTLHGSRARRACTHSTQPARAPDAHATLPTHAHTRARALHGSLLAHTHADKRTHARRSPPCRSRLIPNILGSTPALEPGMDVTLVVGVVMEVQQVQVKIIFSQVRGVHGASTHVDEAWAGRWID